MIRELLQFVKALDPEIRSLGLMPKEGLHLLLRMQFNRQTRFIDENSLVASVYTGNKTLTKEDQLLLNHFAVLTQLSWCINTNKCFDIPTKAIHSCSPYCLAVKRGNLVNGDKYKRNVVNRRSQVYDRIDNYFEKALALVEDERDKVHLNVFKNAINSEAKINAWLERIPEFGNIKDTEYVIFYLDEPVEAYTAVNSKYLEDNVFNSNNYNKKIDNQVYGVSDFFNGFPVKKPFLNHRSATFDISGRIAVSEAKSLYEIKDLINRNIFPCPLPIFIYDDLLLKESMTMFKKNNVAVGEFTYRKILAKLHKSPKFDLRNFYILFYREGEIKDFDFVSKFEYELLDEDGQSWEVEDLFNCGYSVVIGTVFDFQDIMIEIVLDPSLETRTRTGGLQYRYFGVIDSTNCRSDVTYLLVMKYRKALYDFVFKSQRKSINKEMFDDILQTSIVDDIRMDEFNSGRNSRYNSIHQKLNIWFSLSEKFNLEHQRSQTMACKLRELKTFIQQLKNGKLSIENDDQYTFTVGQVIAYLMFKSKLLGRSYQRIEPFLQQSSSNELNKALTRMFDLCKHETVAASFRIVFAEVLLYKTTLARKQISMILAGFFSKNTLFNEKLESSTNGPEELNTSLEE